MKIRELAEYCNSIEIDCDKCNGKTDFSDCEIAVCSIYDSVRLFRYMWKGIHSAER